jgi:hypothetical protein
MITDTERLDFMLSSSAFTVLCNRDGSILQYQLMTQDEDENYHVLHDEHRFFNTERDAIDAAINRANAPSSEEQSAHTAGGQPSPTTVVETKG